MVSLACGFSEAELSVLDLVMGAFWRQYISSEQSISVCFGEAGDKWSILNKNKQNS